MLRDKYSIKFKLAKLLICGGHATGGVQQDAQIKMLLHFK